MLPLAPVPMMLFVAVSMEPAISSGVLVPRNSRVALSYGGTNVLRSVYAEPLAFEPDRWLDDGTPLPATFSSGYRLCMGLRFAHLEFKLLLAHVLGQHALQPDGDTSMVNAGYWNARPAGRFRLKVSERESRSA